MKTLTSSGARISTLIAVLLVLVTVLVVAPVANAYEVDCYSYDASTGRYQWIGRRTVDEATWHHYYRMYYGHMPEIEPAPTDPGYETPGDDGSDQGGQNANPGLTLTADEQAMVSLVNKARADAGLKPLEVDYQLVRTARMKSQDMINLGYFDHTSPTHGSPFDLMRSEGVSYRYAGENLAGAATVQRAHTGLMNSDGHRANILNPSYTRIGIGIIDGGRYGKMVTQHFAG